MARLSRLFPFLRMPALLIAMVPLGAGAPAPDSVTAQIDFPDTLPLVQSPGSGPPPATAAPVPSPLALAAASPVVFESLIHSKEFESLDFAKRFLVAGRVDSIKARKELEEASSFSIRTRPAAIRITIATADPGANSALAKLVADKFRSEVQNTVSALSVNRFEVGERNAAGLLNSSVADIETLVRRLDEEINDLAPTAPHAAADTGELSAVRHITAREGALLKARALELDAAAKQLVKYRDLSALSAKVLTALPSDSTDWTPVPRPDPRHAVFLLRTPAATLPWMRSILETDGAAIAAALKNPDVPYTQWAKSYQLAANKPLDLAAAAKDLSARVRLTPIGDGSVVTLGLSGSFRPDDQRMLTDALMRAVLTLHRISRSSAFVTEREKMAHRISEYDVRLRDLQQPFVSLAGTNTATRDTIAAFYASSKEGQAIEAALLARDALNRERLTAEMKSSLFFDDITLIKGAMRE